MPDSFRFRGHRPAPSDRASVLAPVSVADEASTVVELRLYDPIDSWGGEWGVSAKEFADSLAALPASTTEIRLHINSPGGEVWEAVAMVNQLRNHRARVVAIVDGLAASAASVLAAAADETIMGRNSQMMIHDAWGLTIGNRDDHHATANRLDKISDNIASVYADKAGGDVAAWRTAMLAETWYSADEAVEQGLADSVEAAPEPKDQASFDLSMFRHAGRGDAPDPEFVAITPKNTPEQPPPSTTTTGAVTAGPDDPQQPETDAAPTGPSDLMQRRHRLNARKAAGRGPVVSRP